MTVGCYCQQFYCECAVNQPARKLRSYVNKLIVLAATSAQLHRTESLFRLGSVASFNLLHRGPILSICLHAVLFSHLCCFFACFREVGRIIQQQCIVPYLQAALLSQAWEGEAPCHTPPRSVNSTAALWTTTSLFSSSASPPTRSFLSMQHHTCCACM